MSGEAGSEVPGFREEVGNRLRELERNFENRAAAAKAAGVSKSTFQDWVHGKRDPSFEGLARFVVAVGASLDWIAGLDTRRASQPARGEQAPSDDTVPPLAVDAEIVEVAERELRRNERERKINWITTGGRHAVFAKLIECCFYMRESFNQPLNRALAEHARALFDELDELMETHATRER